MQKRKFGLLTALTSLTLVVAGCGTASSSSSSSVSTSTSVSTSSPISSVVPGTDSTISVLSSAAVASVDLPEGVTLATNPTYTTTFTADLYTLDYLATYHAADSEVLVNMIDGLVEFDNYGVLRGALATEVYRDEASSEFKFILREGVKWFTNEGREYAEVVAQDFVTGFQHLLDAEGGLEYIPWGVVKNAYEYSMGEVPFSEVGIKAVDDHTLVYTLEGSVPYFMTMLEYNPFLPLNEDFFLSRGGALGLDEYADVATRHTFGKVGVSSSILYNGAYVMSGYASNSIISLTKNPNYWDAANVKVQNIRYFYDDGTNPTTTLTNYVNGVYTGLGIGVSTLAEARSQFPDTLYTVDTDATTYYGAWNLDRQSYTTGSVVSPKTEAQKADTKKAILNSNFRKAVKYAFDKATWNASTAGEDLRLNALRNTLTHPQFVSLPSTYTEGETSYAGGSIYSDVVAAEYKKLDTTFTGSLADSMDPFYNGTIAVEALALAKTELGTEVTWPITLDIDVRSSEAGVRQANSFKSIIETTLGSENVVINLMVASNDTDYYAAGYRASSGDKANYDFFYGSGWGPDYGDPLTYLNIFRRNGDMMTVIGITEDNLSVYDSVLGQYETMLAAAKAEVGTNRYVLFAKLEAYLLNSNVIIPTTTKGGTWASSRALPRTVPYTFFGTDNYKFKNMLITTQMVTAAQRAEYKASWELVRAALMA